MILSGAFYTVAGGGVPQVPIRTADAVEAYYAPLVLFWALTGIGEMVDATVNRRRGWRARFASSLPTVVVWSVIGVIYVWFVAELVQAGVRNGYAFAVLLIVPPVIMFLAPLPAAAVNWYQAVAWHDDPRRSNMLLAVAAVNLLPVLWGIVYFAVQGVDTIRVVAAVVVAIGFVLAWLLRAEGRERSPLGRSP
jgi:hypothetical protein